MTRWIFRMRMRREYIRFPIHGWKRLRKVNGGFGAPKQFAVLVMKARDTRIGPRHVNKCQSTSIRRKAFILCSRSLSDHLINDGDWSPVPEIRYPCLPKLPLSIKVLSTIVRYLQKICKISFARKQGRIVKRKLVCVSQNERRNVLPARRRGKGRCIGIDIKDPSPLAGLRIDNIYIGTLRFRS